MDGFILVPGEILSRKDLSHADMLLWGLINGLATNNERGFCYASNAYLAEKINLSSRRTVEIIQKLTRLGLIRSDVIRDERNTVLERRIWIAPPPAENRMTPPAKNRTTSCEKFHVDNKANNKEEILSLLPAKPAPTMALFEENFWSLYPKRNGRIVGKQPSYEKWRAIVSNGSSIDEVKQAVINYKASVNEGYAKDPIRFLQNSLWQDYLDAGYEEYNPEVERRKREEFKAKLALQRGEEPQQDGRPHPP
jgi:DNA-binding Lrp family transcriptional regulator